MPNRVIREAFLTSEKVERLGWAEECFYHRLLLAVDDYGRFYADSCLILGKVMPRKIGRVGNVDIEGWLEACVAAGLVRLYWVDGKRFLEVLQFNQRVRAKESKFPAPEGTGCDGDGARPADGGHEAVMCAPQSESEAEAKEEPELKAGSKAKPCSNANTGAESDLLSVSMTMTDAEAGGSSGGRCSISMRDGVWPKDEGEVVVFLKGEAGACRVNLLASEAEDAARIFFSEMEGCGWVDAKQRPIMNWRQSLRAWALRYAANVMRSAGGLGGSGKSALGRGGAVTRSSNDLEVESL